MATLKKIIEYFSDAPHDLWQIEAVVQIEDTGIKSREYPSKNEFIVKDEMHSKRYTMVKDEIVGHYYVYQTTGYLEDSYSGFLLMPYGKNYLKISFAC